MNIQVIASANMCKKTDVKGKLVVVIDVFRTTTVITIALHNGAKSIIPLQTPEEVIAMRDQMKSPTTLTGGERQALKIDGFDLGNSPEEYTAQVVNGKDILFTTTNGTTALLATEGAQDVMLGCFLNVTSLTEKILNSNNDVVIICAGTNSEFSLDDGICAGMIIYQLSRRVPVDTNDLGALLSKYYESGSTGILSKIVECHHVKNLFALGYYSDVMYCLRTDRSQVVPRYHDGIITAK